MTDHSRLPMADHSRLPMADPHINYLAQLYQKIRYGYYPIDLIPIATNICHHIIASADRTIEKIQNPNHPTLTVLYPVLDALHGFIDDATYGAIALLSTSHYEMIKNKLGEAKLDICILKHYIHDRRSTEIYKKFQTIVNDKIVEYKVSLDILAKKRLRLIIGPELYFKEYKEALVPEDLDYVAELHNKGECIVLQSAKNVCIFCKSIINIHNTKNCYEAWRKKKLKKMCGDYNPHNATNYGYSYVKKLSCTFWCRSCFHSVTKALCYCSNEKIIFNFTHLYPALNELTKIKIDPTPP